MKTFIRIISVITGLLFFLFSCNRDKPASSLTQESQHILDIPSLSGRVVIDGLPDEEIWKSAIQMPLRSTVGKIPEDGGESRIMANNGMLWISASIPGKGRLVARSTGVNPSWWREDMVRWVFRFRSPSAGTNMVCVLTINPLGAVSMGSVRDIYSINRNDFLSLTPVKWSGEVMAAAKNGDNGWTAEAALPLKHFDTLGFLSVERIRVQRVNTPEMTWYWPSENEQENYKLAADTIISSPVALSIGPGALYPAKDEGRSLSPEAAVIASLPKDVWSDSQRDSLGITRMLSRSLEKRMTEHALSEKEAFLAVRNLKDWESFREERLNNLLKWIGPLPERTPLNPVVTRRIDQGSGFIIENLLFESRPGLAVTANLYLPDKFSGKIPAVVVVHSHHAPKTQSELQDMGMTWARSGTAVLVMDQLCAGERIQSQPWSREGYYGRYALGNQLYLGGESLIKWMAWDIMRGIDLLTERRYIDPDRIVLLGAVAGGGDPAAVTAVLDKRIAAVIPFNFGEAGPEEHYTEGPRRFDFETADPGWAFWETTRNMPQSVSGQFFPWFVCASLAPRNFIFSFEIGWPGTVEDEPAWARYKKVYGLYGAEDHLASVSGFGPFPGPGECTNVGTFLRNKIYPVLEEWLDIQVPQSEYHNILPEQSLMCLTAGEAASRDLKPAALVCHELVKENLARARSVHEQLDDAVRQTFFRDRMVEKLGDIGPYENPSVNAVWNKQYDGFEMYAYSFETDPGILIPLFLLVPDNQAAGNPAVIAVGEGGKEKFLSLRSGEIAHLLSRGITVCLPDVRGTGELSASGSRGPGAMSLAATELMLGGTMTGKRLKDVRTVIRWLSGNGTNSGKISLWGDSFSKPNDGDFEFFQSPGQQAGPVPQSQAEPYGPFVALLAALYEENVKTVACNGGLVSFSSVLEDSFCCIPQDVVVPGLLEIADISDVVKAIPTVQVMLSGMVDGLNRKASLESINLEYENISNVFLNTDGENPSVAEWLISRLSTGGDKIY